MSEYDYLTRIQLEVGIAQSKQLEVKGLLLHKETFKEAISNYIFVVGFGKQYKIIAGGIDLESEADRYMGLKVYYSEQVEPNEIKLLI